jgi:hypothetical protein
MDTHTGRWDHCPRGRTRVPIDTKNKKSQTNRPTTPGLRLQRLLPMTHLNPHLPVAVAALALAAAPSPAAAACVILSDGGNRGGHNRAKAGVGALGLSNIVAGEFIPVPALFAGVVPATVRIVTAAVSRRDGCSKYNDGQQRPSAPPCTVPCLHDVRQHPHSTRTCEPPQSCSRPIGCAVPQCCLMWAVRRVEQPGGPPDKHRAKDTTRTYTGQTGIT